jgi:dihydroorotase
LAAADLVIKNGRVAVRSSLRACAVAVSRGKISWIGNNANAPDARRTIDASGLLVLPGVIDVHVHMRDPGATYKEDFRSGTSAAAAGGVTTVFDMPNNSPPTSDVETLKAKAREAEEKALVDYALYGLLTIGNLDEIAAMAAAGAVGFKLYLARTTGNVEPPSKGEMHKELLLAARTGRRVSVHAEDASTIRQKITELREAGKVDAIAHYESRPEIAEEKAVKEAIFLAGETRCGLHVAHLSSASGAQQVRLAKRSRQPPRGKLTAETCPHYLLLEKKDYARLGSIMKCNPSIKRREDRVALWRAINDGTIDMVATDHAPHTIEEKTTGSTIFERASGFPGLETSVGLMLTCVNKGLLTLPRYIELSSEAPARAWGLYPRKGRIGIGADGDFTIVDTKKRWRIDSSKFLSKAKYSPFDGFEATGGAVYTIVRGQVAMDRGVVDETSKGTMQTITGPPTRRGR